MKRAVARVKRIQAGTGAKRKAPRRRTAAKVAPKSAKRSRPTARRKKVTHAKPPKPRRATAKRKPVALKPRPKAPARRRKRLATAVTVLSRPARKAPLKAESPALNLATEDAPAGTRRPKRPKPVAKAKSARPRRPIARPKTIAGRPRLKVPAILLEGDEPELPTISGPGEKFALGPETPAAHFPARATHLPATYGTGRLFLTARDPHWLYAHWDINPTVQFQHNARSAHRHLILRMHESNLLGSPVAEIHVHPESRHWFAHVERSGTQYVADLGYYQAGHKWKSLATSAPMRTPPDTVSTDSTVEFATIPLELPFETMLALLEEGEEPSLPLARAVENLRARRLREFPSPEKPTTWTPEQERALAEIVAQGQTQRAQRGSQEITEMPAAQRAGEGSAFSAGSFDLSSYFGGEQISSPLGGGEDYVARDFWLNVNAELVIYGATEPDAKVSIGGKPAALRPDGSFSCRFTLPNGQYELPVVAVSADNTDGRAAELKFSRTTEVFGDVGAQPRDPALNPPTPESV